MASEQLSSRHKRLVHRGPVNHTVHSTQQVLSTDLVLTTPNVMFSGKPERPREAADAGLLQCVDGPQERTQQGRTARSSRTLALHCQNPVPSANHISTGHV